MNMNESVYESKCEYELECKYEFASKFDLFISLENLLFQRSFAASFSFLNL